MLALEPDRDSGVPLLPVSLENRRLGWWMAGIIGVVLLLFFPFGVIVAGAVVYFASTGFAGFFRGISAVFLRISSRWRGRWWSFCC